MSNKKTTFFEWLGVNTTVDFSIAPRVGKVLGAGLFLIALLIILMAMVGLYQLFGALVGFGPYGDETTGAAIRNLGLFLFALFGAPFLVWRSMVAQQQVKVAEQSQITDRINKAVEGLGSVKLVKTYEQTPKYRKNHNIEDLLEGGTKELPVRDSSGNQVYEQIAYEKTEPNLEVRLGAIYALERIAQDSLRDHLQIMEILAAYIRGNAPCDNLEPTDPPFKTPVPNADIQAAISVIGRRSEKQNQLEVENEFRLDLRNTNLRGINFDRGNFSAVIFYKSNLEASSFRGSDLAGTQFFGALLNFIDLYKANLKGTRFDHCILNKSASMFLFPIDTMYGVTFVNSDITAIRYLGDVATTNLTFGSKDTKLANELDFNRNEHDARINDYYVRVDGSLTSEKRDEVYEVEKFADWSPFEETDLAVRYELVKFQKRLGLIGWPYN